MKGKEIKIEKERKLVQSVVKVAKTKEKEEGRKQTPTYQPSRSSSASWSNLEKQRYLVQLKFI